MIDRTVTPVLRIEELLDTAGLGRNLRPLRVTHASRGETSLPSAARTLDFASTRVTDATDSHGAPRACGADPRWTRRRSRRSGGSLPRACDLSRTVAGRGLPDHGDLRPHFPSLTSGRRSCASHTSSMLPANGPQPATRGRNVARGEPYRRGRGSVRHDRQRLCGIRTGPRG